MTSVTPLNHIIPTDVMYNILPSLPAKTLLRFKCVCKDWYNLINDPVFIQHHLNKSSETNCYHHHRPFVFTSNDTLYIGDDIDSPSQALVKFNWRDNITLSEGEHVRYIGSSNGLVCLGKGSDGFIICNPLTRTFKQLHLPLEIFSITCRDWLGLYDFGYDSLHDDYKIVIMKLQEDKQTWVYSLNTDLWRKAPGQYQLSPLHKKVYKPLCSSVFGNGMIHCVVRGVDDYSRLYLDPVDYTDDEQLQIARFNLSSEEWEDDDLGYPNVDPPTSPLYMARPTFLDGCFCVAVSTMEFLLEIWTMKEYGNKESWTKSLHIPYDPPKKPFNLGKPIAYSRTRQIMWLNSINEGYAGIVCYDMQHETREAFKFNIPKKHFEVSVNLCASSLVSIPGSSHMKGQIHQAEEEDDTTVSPLSTDLPVKKEKKKGKKVLYYSWSRTSV